ncbi:hypothetical protein SLA2020_235620 [Shorea laevis]
MDSSDKDVARQQLVLDQLPLESYWDIPLYQWNGFWYRAYHLEAALALRSQFKARPDDIILASPMKTGTTWLKALALSIMQRHCCGDENFHKADEDPLVKNHPAFYVQTLEVQVFTAKPPPDVSAMQSPRLFHTHLPYSELPDSIKESNCKIVYITRNPKDTLVSIWHFFNQLRTPEQGPYPFERAFECFCKGVSHFGPFFEHVLQYWKESLKNPERILFLKYEELKRDTKVKVKELASFLGRPFAKEEEVEDVVWKCSLERLKNLEVNKNGVDPWVGMKNSTYFRKGEVGDWKSMFTPEMRDKLDKITRLKLQGSGLNLDYM